MKTYDKFTKERLDEIKLDDQLEHRRTEDVIFSGLSKLQWTTRIAEDEMDKIVAAVSKSSPEFSGPYFGLIKSLFKQLKEINSRMDKLLLNITTNGKLDVGDQLGSDELARIKKHAKKLGVSI